MNNNCLLKILNIYNGQKNLKINKTVTFYSFIYVLNIYVL